MHNDPLRVLLAIQQADLLDQARGSLTDDPGIEIVATLRRGDQALGALQQIDPDVVVVGHLLPDMTGVSLCRRLMSEGRATSLAIVAPTVSQDLIYASLLVGARACLSKRQMDGALGPTLRSIAAGQVIFTEETVGDFLDRERWPGLAARNAHVLLPHEVEILTLVGEGLSNREIGDTVHVSEHTVKAHLASIMRKLGVKRRAEAVASAMRKGLV